jgi:hypothetical protein
MNWNEEKEGGMGTLDFSHQKYHLNRIKQALKRRDLYQ